MKQIETNNRIHTISFTDPFIDRLADFIYTQLAYFIYKHLTYFIYKQLKYLLNYENHLP